MGPWTTQDQLKRKIVQTREKEKTKQLQLKCGWYTEHSMSVKLQMCETLACSSYVYVACMHERNLKVRLSLPAYAQHTQGRHQSRCGLHGDPAVAATAPSLSALIMSYECVWSLLFLGQARPWKYNTKKLEHWVDTDESGELTFLDRERMLEETVTDSEDPSHEGLALDFNAGPRALQDGTGPSGEAGVEGEACSYSIATCKHALLGLLSYAIFAAISAGYGRPHQQEHAMPASQKREACGHVVQAQGRLR